MAALGFETEFEIPCIPILGFPNELPGTCRIVSYRDVLRPVMYPSVQTPPYTYAIVPSPGYDGTASGDYKWFFPQDYSTMGTPATTKPSGLGSDDLYGGSITPADDRVANALTNSYPICREMTTRQSGAVIHEMNEFLPVVCASFSGSAPCVGAPVRYACVPGDTPSIPDLAKGSFIWNGGEYLTLTVMFTGSGNKGPTSSPVPAGGGIIVNFELTRYQGNGSDSKPIPDIYEYGPGFTTPGVWGEGKIVIPAGSDIAEYAQFSHTINVGEASPTSASAIGPSIGYFGIKITTIEFLPPNGLSEFRYPTMAMLVMQGHPPWPANFDHRAAGAADSYTSFNILRNNAATLHRHYPKAYYAVGTPAAVRGHMNLGGVPDFPAESYRTTSAATLLTSLADPKAVGANPNNGLVYACVIPEGEGWWNLNDAYIKGRLAMTSATEMRLQTAPRPLKNGNQVYRGNLADGAYTWFHLPDPAGTGGGNAMLETLKATTHPYLMALETSERPFPLSRLSSLTPTHVILLSDRTPKDSANFLLRTMTHIEFVPYQNPFIPVQLSTMTPELYNQVRQIQLQCIQFTENWWHVAELWAAIKKGAAAVARAGLGAAATAAISELALLAL